MANRLYTLEEISQGLEILAHSIAKIGLSAQIISPYFSPIINGKRFYVNNETTPLVIILTDVIFHLYGQLSRIYFDPQSAYDNNASIVELNRQLFYKEETNQNQVIHINEYTVVKKKLHDAKKFEKQMTFFSNEHYAHKQIKSMSEYEEERSNLATSWHDMLNLIEGAKIILNSMLVVCGKDKYNFSESVYEDFKDQFWKLINFTEVKVNNDPFDHN